MTATHPTDRHFWRTRSSHPTSEGMVTYQSCPCGRWRILTTPAAAEVTGARPY